MARGWRRSAPKATSIGPLWSTPPSSASITHCLYGRAEGGRPVVRDRRTCCCGQVSWEAAYYRLPDYLSCARDLSVEPGDRVEDFLSCLGPDERLGAFVSSRASS